MKHYHKLTLKKASMSDKSIERLIIEHNEINTIHNKFIREEMGKIMMNIPKSYTKKIKK